MSEVKGMGYNIRKLLRFCLKLQFLFLWSPPLQLPGTLLGTQSTEIAYWVISGIFAVNQLPVVRMKSYIYGENISVMQMDREEHATPLDLWCRWWLPPCPCLSFHLMPLKCFHAFSKMSHFSISQIFFRYKTCVL